LHSAHISSDKANSSLRVLQAISRLKACREVCVFVIEMRQLRRGSALIILVV